MDSKPQAPLTIKEAAQHFGVSERTIRRRIAAGTLRAARVPRPQGYEVFVYLDSTSDNMDEATVNLDEPPVHLDSAALMKALEMVETLQQQNMQLSGQVGYLQAKLQDAEERIRLLEAPKNEPEQQPADDPAGEEQPSWWQRLRRRWRGED